jgi:hypothetical protein
MYVYSVCTVYSVCVQYTVCVLDMHAAKHIMNISALYIYKYIGL